MRKFVRILLVDENKDSHDIFSEAVKPMSSNVQLFSAFDGEAGLKFLHTERFLLPHYVFLDLNAPRLNSKRFLQLVKSAVPFKSVPVILYSNISEPVKVKEMLRLGA